MGNLLSDALQRILVENEDFFDINIISLNLFGFVIFADRFYLALYKLFKTLIFQQVDSETTDCRHCPRALLRSRGAK